MTDHSFHSHPATPAARKACRAETRRRIAECQAKFQEAFDKNDTETIREYEAMVDLLSSRLGVTFEEAFRIVEEGPVIH